MNGTMETTEAANVSVSNPLSEKSMANNIDVLSAAKGDNNTNEIVNDSNTKLMDSDMEEPERNVAQPQVPSSPELPTNNKDNNQTESLQYGGDEKSISAANDVELLNTASVLDEQCPDKQGWLAETPPTPSIAQSKEEEGGQQPQTVSPSSSLPLLINNSNNVTMTSYVDRQSPLPSPTTEESTLNTTIAANATINAVVVTPKMAALPPTDEEQGGEVENGLLIKEENSNQNNNSLQSSADTMTSGGGSANENDDDMPIKADEQPRDEQSNKIEVVTGLEETTEITKDEQPTPLTVTASVTQNLETQQQQQQQQQQEPIKIGEENITAELKGNEVSTTMETAISPSPIRSLETSADMKEETMASAAVVVAAPPTEQKQSLSTSVLPPPSAHLDETDEKSTIIVVANKSTANYRKRKSGGKTNKPEAGTAEEYLCLKRRKINVEGAPKMPLTGYVRYMNDRREELRRDYPERSSMEHTKMIGEEWQALSAEKRAPYMKAAELDKIRYNEELNAFLKMRPDVLASELARNKQANKANKAATVSDHQQQAIVQAKEKGCGGVGKSTRSSNGRSPPLTVGQQSTITEKGSSKRKRTPTPPKQNGVTTATESGSSSSSSSSINSLSSSISSITANTALAGALTISNNGEIPIFTHEFLDHNRTYDLELKALRKSKTDLEQQNAVLEKYVENMKSGVDKLIKENNQMQQKNDHLISYLDRLKRKLAQALSTLPLPSAPNGANMDNIETYMQELYRMSTANTHGPAALNKAKDIIRKLDLQIDL